MMNANFIAPLSLLVFPLFMVGLFMAYRPPNAVAISLFVAEMFLPPLYVLPISPSWLGKWSIPGLVCWLYCMLWARSSLRGSKPFRGIEFVFLLGAAGNFMTYWTNRDPIQYGPVYLPGETYKDFASDTARLIVEQWAVFYLGRVLFKTSRDLVALCRIAALSIAVYSLPILYEIRMSPSLNRLLYGFQASNFDMTVRWGGYRPTVFFYNGLPLAAFTLACTVMALALARARIRIAQLPTKALCVYLAAILVICKSTGAIVYAVFLFPLVLLASARRTLMLSTILVTIFVVYPFLRFNDVVPTKSIVDLFTGLSPERAGSLRYRFDMEQGMADLTVKRPWFGWGAWDRNFAHDSVTGERLSVPDGSVIIAVSSHGLVGFFTTYFPFAFAVLRAPRYINRIRSRRDRLLMSALAVNCAVILFDLILNSAFPPAFMLLFGALFGLSSGLLREEAAQAHAQQYQYEEGLEPVQEQVQGY